MNKKKKIVKAIILTISVVFLLFMVLAVNFFFGKKKYTYFVTKDMGKIQAIELQISGEEDSKVVIYEQGVINEVMDAMDAVNLKPDFSEEALGWDKSFIIKLLGEDDTIFYYMASRDEGYYEVQVDMEDNGENVENIKDVIEKTKIEINEGEGLYELVSKIIYENRRDITVEDIEKLSEDEEHDWTRYGQFQYLLADDVKLITKNGFTSCTPARFNIEGKTGYVIVWFYNGVIEDENGVQRYSDVLQAIVYNENGEEMNLYDEGISTFLEEME